METKYMYLLSSGRIIYKDDYINVNDKYYNDNVSIIESWAIDAEDRRDLITTLSRIGIMVKYVDSPRILAEEIDRLKEENDITCLDYERMDNK